MPYRRKLIEVALPLAAINKESMRDIYLRGGHPRLLHIWWSRKPLATCRAVLFSSLVDDPSGYMPDQASADKERDRLFSLLEDLIKWENSNNDQILDRAQLEIARSVARTLGVDAPIGRLAVREFLAVNIPPILDPFAGGGSIPVEAQRLGLHTRASDINPVAVIINKALIEIPQQFLGYPPIHFNNSYDGEKKLSSLWEHEWQGAEGLAEDIRVYGQWVYEQAFQQVGFLYPKISITSELLANDLT